MSTKSLQQMAAPLVVSFTLRFMFTFVDLAYAAVLGDDNAAVAAIGFYAPIQSIYIAVWVGISAGFTACLSSAFGHRDEARVTQLKRGMLSILSWLVPALVLLGVGIYTLVPYLGLEPEMERAFRIYATTLTIGMPLAGFWSIYPDSIVKAHQDTRSTMIAGLASSFCNVGLNTLFVFAFGWGIFGIAFATVVSRFVGLAYAIHRTRVLERGRGAFPEPEEPRDWPAPVGTILRLSVPGATTWLLAAFEIWIINQLLLRMPDSTTTIAGFTVYYQMMQFALMPAAGTSVAVIPYVALVLPTGDVERIRRELKRTVLGIVALAVAMTVCMGWIFAEPLSEFFVKRRDSEGTVGPQALDALRLLPLGVLAAVPFFIIRPIFEAAHRPKLGVRISVARFVLFSPPLLLLGSYLGPQLGLDGLRGMILGLIAATAIAAAWTWRTAHRVLAVA